MEIGFVTALLGGMLALLSPCSALLLPAFFASTVGTRLQLLAHGGVFYLGLVLTLVPFGLGLGALGSVLISERGLVIAITAAVLLALGLMQVFGIGFDLARIVPGMDRMQRGASTRTGFLRTLLLGAVGGVAGFCAGPILGAILTLALAQGSPWGAGAMLAVYGAGMVAPLVVIAALWQRMGDRARRMLRGRSFTILGRQFHTTSVITGTMIVAVGVLFWTTNGLVAMPALIPTDVQSWIQERGALLADPRVDVIAIVVVTGIVLTVWALRHRRRSEPAHERDADASRPVPSTSKR
ncbi:cytochrome c biogenesis protein CcdA [Microbacterium esteraromaticum]|uniref:cytochrome c biogenesis CcdA family protein n=1 Tax=Microbacterium esteraromaticum TaxID=57043 RepID=UPI001A8F2784|nr:cytochrome c biogenesis CcdA family protein [Microbacterium esteraromaticum]MBN8425662.1 cytochrome c biogenesis protein CcdA [Microbacterium esteraromaticum]